MSNKDRVTLRDQDEIQSAYQKEIDKTWKRLMRRFSNIKEELLFVLLIMITNVSKEVTENEDLGYYLHMPILLCILDEFLSRDLVCIKQPNPDDSHRFVNIILKEFQVIGQLRNRMIESAAIKEEKIILEEDTNLANISPQSESVFKDWSNQYIDQFDGEWDVYYDKKSTIAKELTNSFRIEFRERYGITPQQLYSFDVDLSIQARKQLRGSGVPFIHFSYDELMSMMVNSMSLITEVERKKGEEFLKELEYTPNRHWACSPFVKVRHGESIIYAYLLPVMYSQEFLSGAWLDKVLKGSRTLGMRSRDYGRHFEEYVREILRKKQSYLKVNRGHLVVLSKKYPIMTNYVRVSKIEIDVVAQSKSHVYLISCKAMDQFAGSKLLLSFYLLNYNTFYGSLIWDLKKAAEISDWTECIRHLPRFLEERRFKGKKIVPLLVTSDQRPLGLTSVQQWCIEMKLTESLPEAEVVQAKVLKNFNFV